MDVSYEIGSDTAPNTLYLECSDTLAAGEMRTAADETSTVTENTFQGRSRQAGYEEKTATTVAETERRLE